MNDTGNKKNETSNKKLEWPINKDMVGKKVLFNGFTSLLHDHWSFNAGCAYVISGDDAIIGPKDEDGDIPSMNWGFDFTVIDDPCKNSENSNSEQNNLDQLLASIKELSCQRTETELEAKELLNLTADMDQRLESLTGQLERLIEDNTGFSCTVGVFNRNENNNIPEGVDIYDPNTWKKGDIVECIEDSGFTAKGKRYEVNAILSSDKSKVELCEDDAGDVFAPNAKFKFISRPE